MPLLNHNSLLFILAGLLVCTLTWITGFDGTHQAAWLTVAIATCLLAAGLPHGALDALILNHHLGLPQLIMALTAYVTLALLVVALWWLQPVLFLMAFLAYSALHFGDSDWPNAARWQQCSWGVAVISIPAALQPQQVGPIFDAILGFDQGEALAQALGVVAVPAGILVLLAAENRTEKLLALLMYAVICWMAGPLVGFACYFIALHSAHHMTLWQDRLALDKGWLVLGLSTLVLVLVAIATGFNLRVDAALGIDDASLRYVFLALAALTVPHMSVIYFANRAHRRASKAPPTEA